MNGLELTESEQAPDVKLPSPCSLSCTVVSLGDLLSDDHPVVVITDVDAILTSLLNKVQERKKALLSPAIGWLISGRLGPTCILFMDPVMKQMDSVKEMLRNLQPKTLFWICFCINSDENYQPGDIFICNEVYNTQDVHRCDESLVKMIKNLKYGWNPPGPKHQDVHTGSAQLCGSHDNDVLCSVNVTVMSAADVTKLFSCLKQDQIPWTVVCGVLPNVAVKQMSRKFIQNWELYVAEVMAVFMKEVFDTPDIFAVFNRSEWKTRMKSLCPKIPSQEDNTGSKIDSTVIAQEAVNPKPENDEASLMPNTSPKAEFNETRKPSKYPILPNVWIEILIEIQINPFGLTCSCFSAKTRQRKQTDWTRKKRDIVGYKPEDRTLSTIFVSLHDVIRQDTKSDGRGVKLSCMRKPVVKDELTTYKSIPDEISSTNLSSSCKSNIEGRQRQTKGVKIAPQEIETANGMSDIQALAGDKAESNSPNRKVAPSEKRRGKSVSVQADISSKQEFNFRCTSTDVLRSSPKDDQDSHNKLPNSVTATPFTPVRSGRARSFSLDSRRHKSV